MQGQARRKTAGNQVGKADEKLSDGTRKRWNQGRILFTLTGRDGARIATGAESRLESRPVPLGAGTRAEGKKY